ncbi:hypothetical protein TNCT_529131 [Trichonephila clavata]|uniref:Uncharacterized protein n=1 Tax=Trichonephila clavata TaxID=2740835 RepID=A0A8X6HZ30_TRICU|nr:hypothetical protein TNCT_529131 [Trichonephila clavata]
MKAIFEGIVSNRIDEEREREKQTLCELELQKIRLQIETQRVIGSQLLPSGPKRSVKANETFNIVRQDHPRNLDDFLKGNIRMNSQMRDPHSKVMAVGNQGR